MAAPVNPGNPDPAALALLQGQQAAQGPQAGQPAIQHPPGQLAVQGPQAQQAGQPAIQHPPGQQAAQGPQAQPAVQPAENDQAGNLAAVKKELEELRQQYDAGSVDAALGLLRQHLARPAGIFDPHASLAALEQLVDVARAKGDEKAKRFNVVLRQTRPLLPNLPSSNSY